RPMSVEGTDGPTHKKDQGHGKGHVQVRIGPPQQRIGNMEAVSCPMAPADCPKTWNQANPIAKQNENKDSREKPKRLLYQLIADDPFQKGEQAFDHPFPKVLCSARNFLGV